MRFRNPWAHGEHEGVPPEALTAASDTTEDTPIEPSVVVPAEEAPVQPPVENAGGSEVPPEVPLTSPTEAEDAQRAKLQKKGTEPTVAPRPRKKVTVNLERKQRDEFHELNAQNTEEVVALIDSVLSEGMPEADDDSETAKIIRERFNALYGFRQDIAAHGMQEFQHSAETWDVLHSAIQIRMGEGIGDPKQLARQLEGVMFQMAKQIQDYPSMRPGVLARGIEEIHHRLGRESAMRLLDAFQRSFDETGSTVAQQEGVEIPTSAFMANVFEHELQDRYEELRDTLPKLPPEAQTEFNRQSAEYETLKTMNDASRANERIEKLSKLVEMAEAVQEDRDFMAHIACDEYGEALLSQKNIIFGRASERKLARLKGNYENSVRAKVQEKIADIKATNPEMNGSPEAEAQLNEAITNLVLSEQAEEENALLESMQETNERKASHTVEKLFGKHPKLRLAIGLGLLGASWAAKLAGQHGAAAVIDVARTPLSFVGGALSAESLVEIVRNHFGALREVKEATDLTKMTDHELDRRGAAWDTRFVDQDGERGTAQRFVKFRWGEKNWNPMKWVGIETRTDTTGQRILAERQRRSAEHMGDVAKQLEERGVPKSEIPAAVLEQSLTDQSRYQEAHRSRRVSDRNTAITKWGAAMAGGMTFAFMTGSSAAADARHAAAHGAAAHEVTHATPPPHPHGEVPHGAPQPHELQYTDGAAADSTHETPHLMSAHGGAPDTPHAANAPITSQMERQGMWVHGASTSHDTTHTVATADTSHVVHGAKEAAGGARDTTNVAHAGEMKHAGVLPHTEMATATPHDTAPQLEVVGKDHLVESVHSGGNLTQAIEQHLPKEIQELRATAPGRYENIVQNIIHHAAKEHLISYTDAHGHTEVLTNPDQISAQWKSLDLTKVFTGDHASNLGGLKDHAEHLSHAQVQHIEHVAKANHDWLAAHPHEAFDPAKVEAHLLAQAHPQEVPGAPQDLMVSDTVAAREAHDAMVGVWRRFGERLASQDPSHYNEMMANSPEFKKTMCESFAVDDDIGPTTAAAAEAAHAGANVEPLASHVTAAAADAARASTDAAPAFEHLTLSQGFATAFEHYNHEIAKLFADHDPTPGLKLMKSVDALDAHVAMKKGIIEHFVNGTTGGVNEHAKSLEHVIRDLLKRIPKNEIHDKETLGHVLERVQLEAGKK